MGCGPSKSDLVVVQDVTGMTKKDATESFSRFKKEAGGSRIKLDKFTQLVSSLNTSDKGKTDIKLFCRSFLMRWTFYFSN